MVEDKAAHMEPLRWLGNGIETSRALVASWQDGQLVCLYVVFPRDCLTHVSGFCIHIALWSCLQFRLADLQGKNVIRKLIGPADCGGVRVQILSTTRVTIVVIAEETEVRMTVTSLPSGN